MNPKQKLLIQFEFHMKVCILHKSGYRGFSMLLTSSNQEQNHRNIKNDAEIITKDVIDFQKKLPLQNWRCKTRKQFSFV